VEVALSVEPLDRLQDAEEVATRLGRHPRTVLNLVKRGELRAVRLGPRTVRFDPADVQAYIDAHRTATT
jgi:excisionase family DNA binding protein